MGRIPALPVFERNQQLQSAHSKQPVGLDDSSVLVDISDAAFLLAAESRRNSLECARAQSSSTLYRPVSRLCQSANATTRPRPSFSVHFAEDSRPKSSSVPSKSEQLKGSRQSNRKTTQEATNFNSGESYLPYRVSSAKSIPSKCTEYILVRTAPNKNSLFAPPSKTEKSLLAERFPNIYQQAVGLRQGVYSAPKK